MAANCSQFALPIVTTLASFGKNIPKIVGKARYRYYTHFFSECESTRNVPTVRAVMVLATAKKQLCFGEIGKCIAFLGSDIDSCLRFHCGRQSKCHARTTNTLNFN